MREIIVLDNGLTIILEQMSSIASAAVGVFVNTGARNEKKGEEGISHFIEHMLFKGTKSLSSRELSYAFDMLGGSANAYTSKENTVYYSKVLSEHVPSVLSLILDMLINPLLAQSDIDIEKNVIMEEINMYEDSPEELVVDNLFDAVYDGKGIGTNILGTVERVDNFKSKDLRAYMEENYTTSNMIISICGFFDKSQLMAVIDKYHSTFNNREQRLAPYKDSYKAAIVKKQKDIEQNHMCFAFKAYPSGHENNRALSVMSGIFGDGMSSRLFQKLREEQGLVYSVSSFLAPHKESGMFCIYAATKADSEKAVYDTIMSEISEIKANCVTDDELVRSKLLIKTSTILGFESTNNKMSFNAHDYLLRGRIREISEIAEEIDKVSMEKIQEVASEVFDEKNMSFSVVGRVD